MYVIKNYGASEMKELRVSDDIGKLAQALIPFCDTATMSEMGCMDCPFYEDEWFEQDLHNCMFQNMGYGQPMDWVVEKETCP